MRPPPTLLGPPLLPTALALLLAATGCSTSLPPGAAGPGTYRQSLRFGEEERRRSYRLHVPPSYDGRRPMPLVVVLHGAFGSSRQMMDVTGFNRLADREGFLVAYPDGLGLLGLLRHWNAGFCCGRAAAAGVDDVGFVARVMDEVADRLVTDPRRVYVVGYSNGGMLAYRVAAELGSRVAAVAVFAATTGVRSAGSAEHLLPEPAAPVPVLHLHGRADTNVPYDGGRTGGEGSFTLVSAHESAAFWADRNGCGAEASRHEARGGHLVREGWASGCESTPVELVSLEGWGHSWPGPRSTRRLGRGDPLHGFDAAELIWRFLAAAPRAAPP